MKSLYLGIKKGIGYVLTAAFVIFVAIFGTVTYKNIDPFHKGYVTTDCLGVQPYVIVSGSMEPTIHTGDAVIGLVLDEQERQEVKVGDIVSYYIGNPLDRTVIIHRVEAIDEETGKLVFKGDANNEVDAEEVSREQLLAKYAVRIPGFGFVLEKIKTVPGAIMLLLFGFAVVMFWEFLWEFIDTLVLGEPEEEYLKVKKDESPVEHPEENQEEPKE